MFRCGNKDLGNSGRAFLSCGAVCILISGCIKDTMEGPDFLENGKIPQERKSTFFQVAFYAFIFGLVTLSTLASIVFCLLHQKQSLGFCWAHGSLKGIPMQNSSNIMNWDWNLKHCDGFVKKYHDQGLTIEQSGTYFIYIQIFRIEKMSESFTIIMYKEPNIVLNQAVGPKEGDKSGTVTFGRLFSLIKGDRLYCKRNFDLDKVLAGNLSYWGLFKM